MTTMTDTTFHTLDDIKKKAEELGYDLTKRELKLFSKKFSIFSNHQSHVKYLTVEVVPTGMTHSIKLSIDGDPFMYSTGFDANALKEALSSALVNLREVRNV